MGIGVFVHEFGHALGLPDFYCTDYSYENNAGFGMYDVMDQGAYYGLYARMPVGYTAYEKSFMGWLQIPELTELSMSPFSRLWAQPKAVPCISHGPTATMSILFLRTVRQASGIPLYWERV